MAAKEWIMPKRARELSARTVMSLREDGRYAVGGVPGLCRRSEGGGRSWVLRHQTQKKRQELGLGSFPAISLSEARDLAWQTRRQRDSSAIGSLVWSPSMAPGSEFAVDI